MAAGALLIALDRRWSSAGRRSVAGVLLVAVGAGSFLYHGPAPPGAQFVHDVTIAALVGFLGWWGAPVVVLRWWWGVAVGLVVALLALAPATSGLVLAILAGGACLGIIVRLAGSDVLRSHLLLGALLGLAAAGAALLGATGAPLCAPDSLFQAHAAWHVLSAAALAVVALTLADAAARSAGHSIPAPSRVRR